MTAPPFSRIALCLHAVLLSLLVCAPAFADSPARKVTIIGTAIIKVVPDEMNWTVQVSINDATLAKAKDRHDASLAAALKYIKGLGGAIKDLPRNKILALTGFVDQQDRVRAREQHARLQL